MRVFVRVLLPAIVFAMSVPLGSSYEIRVAQSEDAPAIYDFLVKFFYPEEPINACLKRIPSEISKVRQLSQLGNNLSLIAVSQNDGSILGVAVNSETCPGTTEEWIQSTKTRYETSDPGLYQLYRLVQTAQTKADIWPTTEAEFRGLDIYQLAVRREARGQNIGAALVEASVQLARQKAFKLVTSTCTSNFSAQVMEKLGFERASTVPYNSFVDSDGHPFFTPPPPHTQCSVYIRRLWREPRSYADSLKSAPKRA